MLGRTFAIWFRNVLPFSVISIVVHVPILAYGAWLVLDEQALVGNYEDVWQTASPIVIGVLEIVLTAALTFGVVQQLRGRPASFAAVVGTGMRRLAPASAAGILAGVLTYLPTILAGLVGAATRSAGFTALVASAAGIAVLMIQTALWVTVPVAVVERPGVISSLKRSLFLTRGSRWRIFLVNFVLGLLWLAVAVVVGAPIFDEDPTWDELRYGIVVQVALSTLVFGPVGAVASAVGYHDLRVGKEGADVEDLARVFE